MRRYSDRGTNVVVACSAVEDDTRVQSVDLLFIGIAADLRLHPGFHQLISEDSRVILQSAAKQRWVNDRLKTCHRRAQDRVYEMNRCEYGSR